MGYALRQYSLPLLLAVALHAAAVWALFQGWNPQKELQNVIDPPRVMANLVVLDAPRPKPRPAPPKAAPAEPQDNRAAEREAQERARKAAEAEAAAKQAAEEAARQEAEAERARLQREQEERLARLSELAQSSLDQAIADEAAALAEASETDVVRTYHAAIYDLVRRNWSRPPSARTGMSARLEVELIPNGEVITVTVVESSGNAAFDRSAEQAVRLARRFDVPEENRLFETHFRRFYLLFKPEDLLR